ncbi:MAG: pitrilysin family protein [Leptolyngbyaceae bacterium]|nr:pitrilysin family protein [Leptolyngbyaceae bacterium]
MKPMIKPPLAKFFAVVFSLLIIPAALALIGILPPGIAAAPSHYTELKFPPLSEVKIPPYTRFQLENGAIVYLMEDHELPLVGGTALFRTGDRLEPADQVGLAEIMGDVMRDGGTRRHSADELNQLLEQRAASVETGVSTTAGSAQFGCLTEDLETVFGLFAEVIREPIFAEDQIELAKTQRRGAIARRNDDPGSIAGREFQKLIYGKNSPYARTIEYANLDNISRNDLIKFYERYFYANNMILGIVGDFDSQAMRRLIQAKFGDWQATSMAMQPILPEVSQAQKGGIFFVNQPQLTQSRIQMGHLGGKLNNPDTAALDVLEGVLNAQAGRLQNQVRSRQGLAYSVYAYWSAQYDFPGLFIAGGETRSDATVTMIRALKAEIERIRTTPITPQELTYAKDIVLNSFVFNFQSPSQTLGRLMRYEYYGYPKDFIFRYRKALEAVTVADVQRVAQTYLKPDEIVTLVVGNADAIKPALSSLSKSSPVTQIDVTIPAPTKPGNPT